MSPMPLRVIFCTLGVAAMPVSIAAQSPDALAEQARAVEIRLLPIERAALAQPEVTAAQAALGAQIRAAMEDADPSTPARVERLSSLLVLAEAAQREGDLAAMSRIVEEARTIEVALERAREAAMDDPAVAERVERFRAHVERTMARLEPGADSLLARRDSLRALLPRLAPPAP